MIDRTPEQTIRVILESLSETRRRFAAMPADGMRTKSKRAGKTTPKRPVPRTIAQKKQRGG